MGFGPLVASLGRRVNLRNSFAVRGSTPESLGHLVAIVDHFYCKDAVQENVFNAELNSGQTLSDDQFSRLLVSSNLSSSAVDVVSPNGIVCN